MDRQTDINKLIKDTIKSQSMIKSADIPNIDLYMDQVTTFMDGCLSGGGKSGGEKTLTKTMINNYAKNNLFPSPEKKKYKKDHLILLIFIYYLKNVLSISDIKKLLDLITEEYFGKKDSLTHIYDKLYECREDLFEVANADVMAKLNIAKDIFNEKNHENIFGSGLYDADCEKNDNMDKLQNFFLIIMLTFDITLKKQLIETIISDLSDEGSKNKEKDKDNKKDTKKQRPGVEIV